MNTSTVAKVRDLEAAMAWRKQAAAPIVFTNGVFDLIHPGHVEVLEAARALGGSLVVGVNSDPSARELGKGPQRPVADAASRARVLAAFACVDCVVLFDEPTPLALISALQPDILVKGGDYRPDTVVGADVVRSRGGRVEIIPLIPDQSTTRLVERLRVPS